MRNIYYFAFIACNAFITRVVYNTFIIAIICTCIAHSAFIAHKSQKLHIFILHILTPTRFPCYVLLASSRNPNENPSTVQLSGAINYTNQVVLNDNRVFCVTHRPPGVKPRCSGDKIARFSSRYICICVTFTTIMRYTSG